MNSEKLNRYLHQKNIIYYILIGVGIAIIGVGYYIANYLWLVRHLGTLILVLGIALLAYLKYRFITGKEAFEYTESILDAEAEKMKEQMREDFAVAKNGIRKSSWENVEEETETLSSKEYLIRDDAIIRKALRYTFISTKACVSVITLHPKRKIIAVRRNDVDVMELKSETHGFAVPYDDIEYFEVKEYSFVDTNYESRRYILTFKTASDSCEVRIPNDSETDEYIEHLERIFKRK
ncbi:MAG: hypothetical protein E7623_01060 [Ruminococcaceae bacterium]|nr:hypothetical protein [Oscillospiraceae bacterium]